MALETLEVIFKATADGVEQVKTAMNSVSDAASGASSSIDGTKESVDEATKSTGNLWDKLKSMAKSYVAVVVVKQVVKFAADTVNVAGEAETIDSTFRTMFSTTSARSYVQDYVDAMGEQFKLNETNMKKSANDFSSIWADTTKYTADEKAHNVVHAMQLAMDYAAMYDMSVAEAADHIKGLMVGLNATHDAAFGMTITKEIVENWAGENGIEGNYADMVLAYMQNNADMVGINGQYEREYGFFVTQKNVLDEQVKTLKENVGSYLIDLAAVGTTALNGILSVINGFFDSLGQTPFVKRMGDALGNQEFTAEEMQAIQDSILGPMNAVTSALAGSTRELDTAVRSFDASYKSMMHTMLLLYTGEYSGEDSDLAAAAEAFTANMLGAVEQGRESLVFQYITFVGDASDYAEKQAETIGLINGYYDGIIESVKQKAAEVNEAARLFMENMTPENKMAFAKVAQEAAELTYNASYLNMTASRQRYLDEQKRNGSYSAEGIETLMSGMLEASAESEREYEDAYDDLLQKMYVVAIATGEDPEAFTADIRAEHDTRVAQSRNDALGMLAKTFYEEAYVGGVKTLTDVAENSGRYFGQSTQGQVGAYLDTYKYLFEEIGKVERNERTPEMQAFYDMMRPIVGFADASWSNISSVGRSYYGVSEYDTLNTEQLTSLPGLVAGMLLRDFQVNAALIDSTPFFHGFEGDLSNYNANAFKISPNRSPVADLLTLGLSSGISALDAIEINKPLDVNGLPELVGYVRTLGGRENVVVINIDGVEVARAVEQVTEARNNMTGGTEYGGRTGGGF